MADADGRVETYELWKALWIPLVAFGIVNKMDMIICIQVAQLLFVSPMMILLAIFASRETHRKFREWTWFSFIVVGIPNLVQVHCSASIPERGTASWVAFGDIMINAALISIVALYIAFPSRRITGTALMSMVGLVFVLTGSAAKGVIWARESGLMEYEDLGVYFKTAANLSLVGVFAALSARPLSAIVLVSLSGSLLATHCANYLFFSTEEVAPKLDSFKFCLVFFFELTHLFKMIYADLTQWQ